MAEKKGEIFLSLPADREFVLLARMAISGLGMLAGLDVDLIDDLRTATDECCDCLLHQPVKADRLELRARVDAGRLYCRRDPAGGHKVACHPAARPTIRRSDARITGSLDRP